jgi:hypothetical protein
MFQDELARYGTWVNYGNYGQVWYPTTVTASWRPYVDGRWVPTEDGWIFETDEPWGWATYHYGNWMPTDEYGWVWAPGSTWYPSTVAWRTSDDYIGWAPIPPPNYVPTPAYYPPEGYYPGTPLLDLITAPFWIFAGAANFLLGFGQPYLPAYSYYNSGYLVPFGFIPTIYPRTFLLDEFYFFPYAPQAFFCFGPRFPFVSRVTNINIININRFVRDTHISRFRNVLPPQGVLARNPTLRNAVPDALRQGRPLAIRQAADVRQARGRVARPDAVAAPKRITTEGTRPEVIRGLQRERGGPGGPQAGRAGAPGEARVHRALPETRGRGATVGESRRGLGFPPQSTREHGEMRQHLQQQQRLERQLPQAQQRSFRQQEQQIRRQELFRPQTGFRGGGETRIQMQRAPAPQFSPGRGGGAPSGGRGGISAPSGGGGGGHGDGGGGGHGGGRGR